MRRLVSMAGIMALLIHSLVLVGPTMAQSRTEQDIRLYLISGDIVTGRLIRHDPDLIILETNDEVRTFAPEEITKIVTLESLGAQAKTIKVIRFPHLGFLGGTIGCGSVSLLGFLNASDKDDDARVQRKGGLIDKAKKLEDEARTVRRIAWACAIAAVGFAAYGLYPQQEERRVFPELGFNEQGPELRIVYARRF